MRHLHIRNGLENLMYCVSRLRLKKKNGGFNFIFNNCRRKYPKIPLDAGEKGAAFSRNERMKPIIMNERNE